MQEHNPMHPGEFIKTNYLSELDIHPDVLAKHLHVSASKVSNIIKGGAAVSVDMALKLSAVLGRSPESWLQMQNDYDLWCAKQHFDASKYKPLCVVSEAENEIKSLRIRQENLMPELIKIDVERFRKTEKPDEMLISKANYITSWAKILDGHVVLDGPENYIERYSGYTISQIKTAFEWALRHYRQLELGANFKWDSAVSTILKLIKSKKWNDHQENLLFMEYIKDTRNYDEW